MIFFITCLRLSENWWSKVSTFQYWSKQMNIFSYSALPIFVRQTAHIEENMGIRAWKNPITKQAPGRIGFAKLDLGLILKFFGLLHIANINVCSQMEALVFRISILLWEKNLITPRRTLYTQTPFVPKLPKHRKALAAAYTFWIFSCFKLLHQVGLAQERSAHGNQINPGIKYAVNIFHGPNSAYEHHW